MENKVAVPVRMPSPQSEIEALARIPTSERGFHLFMAFQQIFRATVTVPDILLDRRPVDGDNGTEARNPEMK